VRRVLPGGKRSIAAGLSHGQGGHRSDTDSTPRRSPGKSEVHPGYRSALGGAALRSPNRTPAGENVRRVMKDRSATRWVPVKEALERPGNSRRTQALRVPSSTTQGRVKTCVTLPRPTPCQWAREARVRPREGKMTGGEPMKDAGHTGALLSREGAARVRIALAGEGQAL
jgi:hypothetical protein